MKKRCTGDIFGHSVYIDADEFSEEIKNKNIERLFDAWRYDDNNQLVAESPPRKCPRCKGVETKDGHDPCIKNLPGVSNACCGHGIKRGYIQFDNGFIIRFDNMKVDE